MPDAAPDNSKWKHYSHTWNGLYSHTWYPACSFPNKTVVSGWSTRNTGRPVLTIQSSSSVKFTGKHKCT